LKNYTYFVSAIASLLVLSTDGVRAQVPSPPRTIEDIHVVRSLRIARSEPGEFCSTRRTTFGDVLYEDRYTFAAVTTAPSTGFVTEAQGTQAGSVHACFGSTSDPTVINFYAEGDLNGVSFTGSGRCMSLRSDFPESGLRVSNCFLNLSGLREPYLGGLLTSNSIGSRNLLGAESDPPGYVQPSIATVRLWKRREVR